MPQETRLPFIWLAVSRTWLIACGLWACSAAPLTQVSVELDAESGVRREVTHVRLVVEAGAGDTLVTRFDEVRPATRWPMTAALIPLDGRTSRVMRIEAQGLTGASIDTARVVSRVRLVTGFADGRAVRATLRFEDCCRGATCGDDETCSRCDCVDARMDAATLPDLIVDASMTADAGISSDAEARTDGPFRDSLFDATSDVDAGSICVPSDWQFEQVADEVAGYPTAVFDEVGVLHTFAEKEGTPQRPSAIEHRHRLMPGLWSSPATVARYTNGGALYAATLPGRGLVVCQGGCWVREANGTFTRLDATPGPSSVGVHEGRLFVASVDGTGGVNNIVVNELTSATGWTRHQLAPGTSAALASFDGSMRAVIVDVSGITERSADGSGTASEIGTFGSIQPALGVFGDELLLLHGVDRGMATALVVSSRTRGGAWMSGTATLDSAATWRAHLARDRSGRAHAAWSTTGGLMRYATRDVSGTWHLPEDLPRIGVNTTLIAAGDVVVLGFLDRSTHIFWIASRTACAE